MDNRSELNSWRVIKPTGEVSVVHGELFEDEKRKRIQETALAKSIKQDNIQARNYDRMEILKKNKRLIAGISLFALTVLGLSVETTLANGANNQEKARETAEAKASSALIMEGFHRPDVPLTVAKGMYHIDLTQSPLLPRTEPLIEGDLSDAISNHGSNIMGINLYDPSANDTSYSTQENPVIIQNGESVDGSRVWMTRRFKDGVYGNDTIGWIPVNKNTQKYIKQIDAITGEEMLVTVESILKNAVTGVSAPDEKHPLAYGNPGPGLQIKEDIIPVDLVVTP